MGITDKRAKFDALLKALKVPAVDLKVGIFSDAGEEPDGQTVVDVATYHEYGYGVPERSFLRGYVEENQDKILDDMTAELTKVVEGKRSLTTALNRVGLVIVGGVKERISNRIDPALADETIARKGSDVPLIDTGQLRNSVVHKVDKH